MVYNISTGSFEMKKSISELMGKYPQKSETETLSIIFESVYVIEAGEPGFVIISYMCAHI